MKSLLVLAVIASCACAMHFDMWSAKHGKRYSSNVERAIRSAIFAKNAKLVERLNAENPATTFVLNEFADLTQEEFASRYLSSMKPVHADFPVYQSKGLEVPDAVDWREKGAVGPVKNQDQCGSCWAFSTVANVEGAYAIKKNEYVAFSEQQLVDCDRDTYQWEGQDAADGGCKGGLMMIAFQYLLKYGGLMLSKDYPYVGKETKCQFDASKVVAKPTNWTMVGNKDEVAMKEWLAKNGPISVAVDARWWQFYGGGVYERKCGDTDDALDHGVAVVGYGSENGKDFWIVRNSWGPTWGESGYMKLLRGVNKCGVALDACSTIL